MGGGGGPPSLGGASAAAERAARSAGRGAGVGDAAKDSAAAARTGGDKAVRGGLGGGERKTGSDAAAAARRARHRQRLKDAVLLSGTRAGIPLREGLQSLFRVQRYKFLAEGALFLAQFALLLFIVTDAFDARSAFSQEAALGNAVLGADLTAVASLGDVWDWLDQSALPGLWPTDLYEGQPLRPQQLGMVASYNQLVGPVELRQARVGSASCDDRRFLRFGPRFDTPDGSCYAEFVPGKGASPDGSGSGSGGPMGLTQPTESTEPFGLGNASAELGSPPYTWSLHPDDMQGELGFGVDSYGFGGFSVYIPSDNATLASEAVARLRAGRFLDRSTRVLGVHVTIYNTNTRLLQCMRVAFEQLPSGLVRASWTSGVARVLLYEDKLGITRAVAESLFCALLLVGVIREARRVYHTHPHRDYFLSAWNLYELANHSSAAALVVTWLVFVLDSQRIMFDASSTLPAAYWGVVQEYKLASDLAGLLFVLSAAKLFKFLQALDKRMAVLWLTLQRAARDVALFMVGFMAVLLGFALAGVQLFGPYSRQFYSVPVAMATLLQYAVGELSYDDIARSRPYVAPWFTFVFVLTVGLLFANVLIAIVTLAFEDVNAEIQVDQTWQEGLPELPLEALMAARRCGRRIKTRCPCCYAVFCFCRAGKARKLRRERARRAKLLQTGTSGAAGPGSGSDKRRRLSQLSVQPTNAEAKKAGLDPGESLDAWMVRQLLDGLSMPEVREAAQVVLDEDERIAGRDFAATGRQGRAAIVRAATGLSNNTSLGSSRRTRSKRGHEGGPCAQCCRRWCCCSCCWSRLGLGPEPSIRDLYEPSDSSDSDGPSSPSGAAAGAGRGSIGFGPGAPVHSASRAALTSPPEGLRERSTSKARRGKSRTLPTDRTLFHAVRAEAEALEQEEEEESHRLLQTALASGEASGEAAPQDPERLKKLLLKRKKRRFGRVGSASSMQMQVWEAQEAFLNTMRLASRAARRRQQRSVDLFAYFQTAWIESGGRTMYMSLQELCLLTSGSETCKHDNCIAQQVVDAYQAWKAVILLRGEAKTVQAEAAPAASKDGFFTIKVNKAGRKQERIIVVDRAKGQLKGFDMRHNLRRVLPLSQLVQIEQSTVDSTRVNLVFADGVGANWALLFVTPAERKRFCRMTYQLVMRKRHGADVTSTGSAQDDARLGLGRPGSGFASVALAAASKRKGMASAIRALARDGAPHGADAPAGRHAEHDGKSSAEQSPEVRSEFGTRSRVPSIAGDSLADTYDGLGTSRRPSSSLNPLRRGPGATFSGSGARRSLVGFAGLGLGGPSGAGSSARMLPVTPSSRTVASGVTAPWEYDTALHDHHDHDSHDDRASGEVADSPAATSGVIGARSPAISRTLPDDASGGRGGVVVPSGQARVFVNGYWVPAQFGGDSDHTTPPAAGAGTRDAGTAAGLGRSGHQPVGAPALRAGASGVARAGGRAGHDDDDGDDEDDDEVDDDDRYDDDAPAGWGPGLASADLGLSSSDGRYQRRQRRPAGLVIGGGSGAAGGGPVALPGQNPTLLPSAAQRRMRRSSDAPSSRRSIRGPNLSRQATSPADRHTAAEAAAVRGGAAGRAGRRSSVMGLLRPGQGLSTIDEGGVAGSPAHSASLASTTTTTTTTHRDGATGPTGSSGADFVLSATTGDGAAGADRAAIPTHIASRRGLVAGHPSSLDEDEQEDEGEDEGEEEEEEEEVGGGGGGAGGPAAAWSEPNHAAGGEPDDDSAKEDGTKVTNAATSMSRAAQFSSGGVGGGRGPEDVEGDEDADAGIAWGWTDPAVAEPPPLLVGTTRSSRSMGPLPRQRRSRAWAEGEAGRVRAAPAGYGGSEWEAAGEDYFGSGSVVRGVGVGSAAEVLDDGDMGGLSRMGGSHRDVRRMGPKRRRASVRMGGLASSSGQWGQADLGGSRAHMHLAEHQSAWARGDASGGATGGSSGPVTLRHHASSMRRLRLLGGLEADEDW
ncbi:hypothetical protein FNF31_07806 [Cafeteria roenbergensis]|uniref:Uncharacterized protein n=1 Tax=Cafeteria roenbergensis TaxID=33653 RepID=A0A5A8C0L1_CAFRO|nr:hypothetical protein FNF31_07806 [Cafeteria roenbergensis]